MFDSAMVIMREGYFTWEVLIGAVRVGDSYKPKPRYAML